MNLTVDESIDQQVVEELRRDGHDVLYVAETEPGIADALVLNKANEQNALLVTADKDFGELVFRLGRSNSGVLLLAGVSPERKALIVSAALREHGSELRGGFGVVTPGIIRIRRKSS